MQLGHALERRRRAGRPDGLAGPRAGHRAASASVLAVSHCLEPRATGLLSRLSPRKGCRPCCAVLARSEMSRGSSPVSCAHKPRMVAVPWHWSWASRYCAQPVKAAHRLAPRTPQHMLAVLPVRPTEAPPPLARFAAVHHLLTAPHGPYNLPVPPVLLPRPGVRWSRAVAAVLPARRRPASCRRPSAHPRPQTGCG
jgi:hypothetical protein